jgi:hypothetical protein
MTDDRWLGCTDPHAMLEHLRSRVTERKLRLFACACVRLHWDDLFDPRSRAAVEVAERYADGLATEVDRFDAWDEANDIVFKDARVTAALHAAAEDSEYMAGDRVNVDVAHAVVSEVALRSRPPRVEHLAQCGLPRCIFGVSPFATPPCVPDAIRLWSDRTVPRLARLIYDEHAFGDLPILADALEDAGCRDEVILDHLRSGGPHAPGCFALDACLLP